ncbi:hypothetical protein FWK35_00038273 [Aphis craccivora]|uniref:Uncharacterized protein n=1 Tax=Aphis craccivora TaxID=307492 RepID=A0A6G0VLT3_APHCR|nr:hypothetical protein FWK35_00038273 [Aphis craccivora]
MTKSISLVQFSNSFKKNGKPPNKSNEKTRIFTQYQFSTKSIFYMVITQKRITENT